MTDTPATETKFVNPDLPQGPDDSSTEEPPTMTIEATFEAPEIEAQQAAFSAEYPELEFLSVEFFKGLLRNFLEDLAMKATARTGTGTFELKIDDVLDGITVHVLIQAIGANDAQKHGSSIANRVTGQMHTLLNELMTDPVGEHRRKHIQELREMELSEDELKELSTTRLGALCGLVGLYSIAVGKDPEPFMPMMENIHPKPTEAQMREIWASLGKTFQNRFED